MTAAIFEPLLTLLPLLTLFAETVYAIFTFQAIRPEHQALLGVHCAPVGVESPAPCSRHGGIIDGSDSFGRYCLPITSEKSFLYKAAF